MQNYLQKPNSKISRLSKTALSALVAFATLAVVVSLAGYYGNRLEENPPGSSAVPLYVKQAEKSGTYEEDDSRAARKMNNSAPENSKNAQTAYSDKEKWRNCTEYVRVLQNDGSIIQMNLEEYVTGCVFGEMPISFEVQALMAQSVAVRTFTVRQMSSVSKHKNADVCTNPACCQSYKEPDDTNLGDAGRKKLTDAVNATKGIIVTYENSPIEAVYHASSGECTLNSEDVWGARVDYLRSVPAPEEEAYLAGVVYGHRVGMSQHGANILARQGYDFCDILKYYYSGTGLDFVF